MYMYMLQGKYLLEASGVLCQRHIWTELSDWVMAAIVAVASVDTARVILCNAVAGTPLTQQARRGAHLHVLTRALIASGIMLSALKLAALMSFEGPCAFPELIWCLIFIAFGLSFHLLGAPSIQQAEAVDMEVARAEVAKVMASLSSSTWSDGGADGDPESGGSLACSICLGDWEPGDCFKTTPCSHSFHEGCLRKWLLSSASRWGAQPCAMCRRDLRCTGGLADGGGLRGS
jgi:hypothetical protein